MRSSEPVLAETSKVWHVHGKRREEPDDDVQSSHRGVPDVHVAGCNFEFTFDERTAAVE